MLSRTALVLSLGVIAGAVSPGPVLGQEEKFQVTPEFAAAENVVEELTGIPINDPESQARLLQARAVFQAAAEKFLKATLPLNYLGRTYAFPGQDTALGVAAFEKSLALVPNQPDVIARLVEIHLVAGERSKAGEVQASRIDRAASPDLAARVDRMLANWDSKEGLRLLREGRRDEGVALLDQAIQECSDAGLQARFRSLKDDALAEWEANTYNAALAKAKAQDFRGALAILEKLIPVAKTPEIIERARRLRDRVAPAAQGAAPPKS